MNHPELRPCLRVPGTHYLICPGGVREQQQYLPAMCCLEILWGSYHPQRVPMFAKMLLARNSRYALVYFAQSHSRELAPPRKMGYPQPASGYYARYPAEDELRVCLFEIE